LGDAGGVFFFEFRFGSYGWERVSVIPYATFDAASDFSRCPPNWNRIADRTLLAKSASPRELKRS
jgi:hypothetical protein